MLLARCSVLKLIPRKINTNLDQAEILIFTCQVGRDLNGGCCKVRESNRKSHAYVLSPLGRQRGPSSGEGDWAMLWRTCIHSHHSFIRLAAASRPFTQIHILSTGYILQKMCYIYMHRVAHEELMTLASEIRHDRNNIVCVLFIRKFPPPKTSH